MAVNILSCRPTQRYHSQVDLIWLKVPFKKSGIARDEMKSHMKEGLHSHIWLMIADFLLKEEQFNMTSVKCSPFWELVAVRYSFWTFYHFVQTYIIHA
jgi:hypothetical protein